jgi:pimeloyl-ACP methyl ester carboxylesterase
VRLPETRYARSGEVRIAYQVVGNGPIDLVFVPGFISNLDVHREDAGYGHLLRRLGAFTRLIQLDKRGTGLSDRVAGKAAIVAYYDDVCSRAMTHSMESGVADGERLAFTQACACPDGTRVFCAAMIELAAGKITKQTVVQAWDA